MHKFFDFLGQFIVGFFGGIGGALLTPELKPVYVGIIALLVFVYTVYELFISKEEGRFNRIAAVDIGAFVGLLGAMK